MQGPDNGHVQGTVSLNLHTIMDTTRNAKIIISSNYGFFGDKMSGSLSKLFMVIVVTMLFLSSISIVAGVFPNSGGSYTKNMNLASAGYISSTSYNNSPWIPLGPNNIYSQVNSSGKISALAVDWNSSGTMYLGSGYGPSFSGPGGSGGIYKTTDYGKTWAAADTGLGTTIIDSLIMAQDNPDVLLASTYTGGIYKTSDGGAEWYQTAPYLMSFDFAAGGSYVYVPTYSGIAISNNFGSTWNISLRSSVPFFSVTTTSTGEDVYAIDWNGVVYHSSNHGVSWTTVHHFSNVSLAYSISVAPWNGSLVYLAYSDFGDSNTSTLYRSMDNGSTWTSFPEFYSNTGHIARSIAFDYQNHSVFYVTGQAFTDVSTNNGTTFATMNEGRDNRLIWTNPSNGSDVYVGSDQGLFYTESGGATWICVSAPLNVSMLMDVAAANGGSELQVAVQDYASLYSLDNGTAWKGNYPSEGDWPGEGGTVVINPVNSSLVYFYTGGVLKISNTTGQSWTTIKTINPTEPGIYFPEGIAIDPERPNIAYLAGLEGIYKTVNWGKNWTLIPGSPVDATVLEINPLNDSDIWVGTSDGLYQYIASSNTWIRDQASISHRFMDSIAIDPMNDEVIVFGTGLFESGGIYRSVDGGISFTSIGSSLNLGVGFVGSEGYTSYYGFPVTDMLFVDQDDVESLIVSTDNGLFLTSDLGATWISLDYNLISTIVTSVTISGLNLFISTWGEGVLEFRNFSPLSPPGYNIATFIESGLPVGAVWQMILGVALKATSRSKLIFGDLRGSYSYTVLNATDYYPSISNGNIAINDASVEQPIAFEHFAYITGSVFPLNSTVFVNNNSILTSSGTFNISVYAGDYSVRFTDSGYITQYSNFSLAENQTKNFEINLTKSPSETSSLSNYAYYLAGAGALVFLALVSWTFNKRKKR